MPMKRQNHDRKFRDFYAAVTLFFFVGLCSLIFSPPAFATDKVHLDNVPYVVQKERLD